MTTTAFDDQFTSEPEPVRQQYSTADILRRNVADLELALKKQTERAEAAEEKLTTAREDMQSLIDSRNGWMERAGAAEAELAKLREQEPIGVAVACNKNSSPGFTVAVFSEADVPTGSSVYAGPVPAPAVLKCWLIERPATSEWPAIWLTITTDGRRWVSDGGTMYASGGDWYFTTAAVEALKFADKESADEYVRHNKIKDVVATEHIFEASAMLQSAEVTK